jgi:hypothetical protein
MNVATAGKDFVLEKQKLDLIFVGVQSLPFSGTRGR